MDPFRIHLNYPGSADNKNEQQESVDFFLNHKYDTIRIALESGRK